MEPTLRLGAWEHLLAADQLRDNAQLVGWLVELEGRLDPTAVEAALAVLRPLFPLYFAQVRSEGRVTEAVSQWPVARFIHRAAFEGGGDAYLHVLANARLDPVRDGLFRCHLVEGRESILAFQFAHVGGDGYTASLFRMAFASAMDSIISNRPQELRAAARAHELSIEHVTDVLLMDVGVIEDIARRKGQRREAVMSQSGELDHTLTELRVFHATIERNRHAPIVARARAIGVTPLALLTASFARALKVGLDSWAERPDDFLGLAVPHDLRSTLGKKGAIGNLSLPQGLPLYADDPEELEPLAVRLFDRMVRGRRNRLLYRHFLTSLREASARGLEAAMPPPRLRTANGRTVLQPFAALGVTEVHNRGEIASIGSLRVLRTFFQTPLLTRRFADDRVHLSCTVSWHQAFDARLRSVFASLVQGYCGGDAEWKLL